MDDKLKSKEKKLSLLETESEIVSKEAEIAQKKALEAEAKAKYGKGWRKILGVVKSIKPDREVIMDLYGLGAGDTTLRDLNDPRKFGGRRG